MVSHVIPFLAAALVPAALAQFVTPPSDLKNATGYAGVTVRYKEVPSGICELNSSVKSYSGYADVGPDTHIFFWFFEARDVDPTEAPLTTWINGGPGSTSLIGLFEENGPCRLDRDGKVLDNPYSWSKYSNMLFIDQPAAVGLSYTKTVNGYRGSNDTFVNLGDKPCPTAHLDDYCGTFSIDDVSLVPNTTMAAAPGFWKTVQGFMGVFPQYSRNGFNFATESYGGHYGPVFNDYIEQQNKNLPAGAHEIHLDTVLIGNGWFDPLTQFAAYYNFTVSPGNTYDYMPYNASMEKQLYDNVWGENNCIEQLKNCAATNDIQTCTQADKYCADNVEAFYTNNLHRDEYDLRELSPDPFPGSHFGAYVNTPLVQQALGAFTNLSDGSIVGDAFALTGDDSREDGTIEKVQDLLSSGVKVVLYHGDADYNCNWLGGEVIASKINAPGFSSAGYADLVTPDRIIHGAVKQSGNFSFVRVYESGHEVPFYQPLAAVEIFRRAISGKDIETGTKAVDAGYLTEGSPISTYRQGNGTVQFHVLPANSTYSTTLNGPNPIVKSPPPDEAGVDTE